MWYLLFTYSFRVVAVFSLKYRDDNNFLMIMFAFQKKKLFIYLNFSVLTSKDSNRNTSYELGVDLLAEDTSATCGSSFGVRKPLKCSQWQRGESGALDVTSNKAAKSHVAVVELQYKGSQSNSYMRPWISSNLTERETPPLFFTHTIHVHN